MLPTKAARRATMKGDVVIRDGKAPAQEIQRHSVDAIVMAAYQKFACDRSSRRAMKLCFGADGKWAAGV